MITADEARKLKQQSDIQAKQKFLDEISELIKVHAEQGKTSCIVLKNVRFKQDGDISTNRDRLEGDSLWLFDNLMECGYSISFIKPQLPLAYQEVGTYDMIASW
jgi:hypothetical protein